MLVVCLVMISGLLALIVVSGLPTFWPTAVHWLLLNDGSLEIGQPQKLSQGALNTQRPADIPTNLVGDNSSRYYRTGNFDLTGQHYRWFAPWELDANGLASPEWAVVVERTQWGRLYGILNQVSVGLDVDAATEAQFEQLEDLVELVTRIPSDQSELSMEFPHAVEEFRAALRSQALRAAVAADTGLPGVLQVQTAENSTWHSAEGLIDETALLAARRLVTTSSAAYEQLQQSLEESVRQRNEIERFKYRISKLDARIADMRLDIRRAELKTKSTAAQQVELSHTMLEQLEQLARLEQAMPAHRELIAKIAAGKTWEQAAQSFSDSGAERLIAQLTADFQEQLNIWLAPVQQQPEALREAILRYQAEFRQVTAERIPLDRQLRQRERQLALVEASFAVPFAPAPIASVASDLDQLAVGKLPAGIVAQLSEVQPDPTHPTLVERFGPHLTLITFYTQQSEARVIAVAEAGYLAGSSEQVRKASLLGQKNVPCADIVRVVPTNRINLSQKMSVYLARWREFLLENPREANAEGGVFPAIWGTVVMTLIMTIAVVPFGVMAALYLREYTRSGPIVSMIRISINNLAGVPSIVYGVFGFSFFCYTIGAFVDGGPRNAGIAPWPSHWWFLAMGITAATGCAAFFCSLLSSGPSHKQNSTTRWLSRVALVLWLASTAAICVLVLRSPFFEGFYREHLPNPTFGKGGLLWASLTLALLTLPVVIVATEEALAAVPNSLREGSLACGASKWQTIRRIVLPHARPGILTGAILAMARGAGEVAPLMLVGALPSAPDLPLDTEFPFIHGSRSFMHLGYQIYTLGFQSQNSEASKPMVFTCTLLLIAIVATLNVAAIYLRARLKQRFQGDQF
jgi:ABC-type phosphate transport system permease subunit